MQQSMDIHIQVGLYLIIDNLPSCTSVNRCKQVTLTSQTISTIISFQINNNDCIFYTARIIITVTVLLISSKTPQQ